MPKAKRDKNGNIIYERDKNGKIRRYKDGRKKVKRSYRDEYDSYHGKPKQIKNRTARNGARAKINAARKRRGLPKLKTTQEVDHKRPLSKGGGNGRRNLSVKSRAANRKKSNK
tara:strand:- start:1618 stop:1956 length:339 start_codon:yes stop_codon:yes gene_type:complete